MAQGTIALPADIQQLLDAIDAADRQADAIVGALTDEQLYWQPDGGRRWSVAQCIEHMAATNDIYGDAVRRGIEGAGRREWRRTAALAPGYFGRRFVRIMEPPVTRRVRTFAVVVPGTRSAREEILRRYHEAHVRVKQLIVDAAAIDANRATFQNPFVKFLRLRVSTGLQVIAAHNRRHLWQAEQIMKDPRFPAAPAPSIDRSPGRTPADRAAGRI